MKIMSSACVSSTVKASTRLRIAGCCNETGRLTKCTFLPRLPSVVSLVWSTGRLVAMNSWRRWSSADESTSRSRCTWRRSSKKNGCVACSRTIGGTARVSMLRVSRSESTCHDVTSGNTTSSITTQRACCLVRSQLSHQPRATQIPPTAPMRVPMIMFSYIGLPASSLYRLGNRAVGTGGNDR